MPISSGGPSEKQNVFSAQGKPPQNLENGSASRQINRKLLKIAPALPLLPAVPKPPKLHQRSNTTLGGSGVTNGEAESGVSSGVVFLQTNNEGKIQASRSQKDRERNPDRISLDRRGLTTVPILVGESKVRLLSLQHNLITRLDNIQSLGLVRLVFLDIYDNQLDRIAGLDSLPNLRVLLMGKNRIRRMEGLKSLSKLEVLDLHGNQITQISGLTMLNELKVLNLAGNQIRVLGTYDLQGLRSLQELNLRRNRLKRLLGFAETLQLNKLFLSNNEIQSIEDMNSVLKAVQLKEISVDGNPVALSGDCASFLVSHLPQLQLLSHMQVTEQVRRAALAWRSTKEASCSTTNVIGPPPPTTVPLSTSQAEGGAVGGVGDKRDEVIYNARTNWELLRSQTARSFANIRKTAGGKIRRMEGLKSLSKLEVLDLHGNQITQISGLTMLNELKVLNLAGNQIRVLGTYDLQGLRSLQELNLRRNRLKRLLGFAETLQLNKLFLSNNEIQSIEDMNSVLKAVQLKEISVDGNPIALSGDCASFLVSHLPQLQLLSHMQVTEQVRRAALAWRSTKEASCSTTNVIGPPPPTTVPLSTSQAEGGAVGGVGDKRDEVIYNARTNWELLRSQTARSFANIRKTAGGNDGAVAGGGGRSDESELESLPLSARAVRLPERAEVKRAEYSRRRTVSQGLDKVLSSPLRNPAPPALDTSELYRLPPILAPLAGSPEEGGLGLKQQADAAETVSSVEPVADSSLSSLPSDTSSEEDEVSEDAARWRLAGGRGRRPSSESTAHAQRSIKSANNTASSSSSSQNKHSASASGSQHSYCRTHSHRAQTTKVKTKTSSTPGKIREQGGDYLVEISGRYLNVYGQGALKFIDRPWNPVKAGDVTTIRFNYVNFNSLAPVLCRLKQRFPNAEHFMFRDTNVQALGQLNALADIQGLTSLTIHPEGNPIYDKEWRSYAIYRLSHWGLSNINDLPVTEEEIVAAASEFAGLSDLVLSSLPDSLLQPLLSRLRLETQQQSARDWLWAADPALRTVVAKEALQWRRLNHTQDDLQWRQKGRAYLEFLIEQACSAFLKLKILEEEWSNILMELIRDTLVDYSQLDDYMKHCMNEITKN
ncbi:uncharacterized protein LOC111044844 [Nilaparvata lugens]|uniref:uncharacterized protein LOC111044844 n=1 Tax=Nilaparvata lugens TaxID=108931 RepID=UPI00193D1B09|nr:uncharacterized protein LOC111044844 [Nilaparvata lugens]